MVVRVHGGIINDQMLAGSLRYFEIADTGVFADTIGTDPRLAFAGVEDGGVATYVVGNVLTVVGGTGTAATLTVASVENGLVNSVTVSNPGAYTVLPTNPVSVTGGGGTGATFNLAFSSTIIIPGAAFTGGNPAVTQEFYVGLDKAVPNSAANRALQVVSERANIVQVAVIDDDTLQIAIENTSFAWDTEAAGDAPAEMQAAIRALGIIGSGAVDSSDPPVPDTTNTGTTVDLSTVTVTEKAFVLV
jgi:hypothetical protein